MAEKTFSIDLEETLHERARRLALERKIAVKRLYAQAISALLDGELPYPYEENGRSLHDRLERILESNDQATIDAVVSNIEVFFDRLKPQKAPARREASTPEGAEEFRLLEEYRRASYEKRKRMLSFAAKGEDLGPEVMPNRRRSAGGKNG